MTQSTNTTTSAAQITTTIHKKVYADSGIIVDHTDDIYTLTAGLNGVQLGEIIIEEDDNFGFIPKQDALTKDEMQAVISAMDSIRDYINRNEQFDILKFMDSYEEYKNSEELAEIFKPYAKSELNRELDKFESGRCEFVSAYVVKGNFYRALNGREPQEGIILVYRHKESGLLFMGQVSAGSCISARPWRQARIYPTGIELTHNTIEKTDENREIYGGTDVILCSI